MSDVKRYDLEQPDSHMGLAKMQREDYGDWVSFEDYTSLRVRLEGVERERDRLAEINKNLCQSHNHLLVDGSNWQRRAERAEASLATARRDAPTLDEAAAITRELRQLGWLVPLSIVRAATDAAHARALKDQTP